MKRKSAARVSNVRYLCKSMHNFMNKMNITSISVQTIENKLQKSIRDGIKVGLRKWRQTLRSTLQNVPVIDHPDSPIYEDIGICPLYYKKSKIVRKYRKMFDLCG